MTILDEHDDFVYEHPSGKIYWMRKTPHGDWARQIWGYKMWLPAQDLIDLNYDAALQQLEYAARIWVKP